MGRALLLATLAASLELLAACRGGSAQAQPQATLAETSAAQTDFRRIQALWLSSADRSELEAEFRSFLVRFAGDDRTRLVRVYLALVHVDRGELGRARQVLEPLNVEPRGTARDFARVAEAAILVRAGKPERALELLEPLTGKLVDADERYVFGEQIVAASLAARRWRAAIDHTIAWLAHVQTEDVESAQQRAARMLEQVPLLALEQRLQFLDAESDNEYQSTELLPARDWLRKVLRERLVESAITRRDAALAGRLLNAAPALRRAPRGPELVRLASSETALPYVAGRSIGLVLSQSSADSRRRSSEVAAGMTRALGLPRGRRGPDSVALLLRSENGVAGEMENALASLAGEGAAILVAGVDTAGAERAARYAATSAIPVMVLALPPGPTDRFTFVLGANRTLVDAEVEKALEARGVSSFLRFDGEGWPCRAASAANEERFPLAVWKREAGGILFSTDARCVRRVLQEFDKAGVRPRAVLDLECAELAPGLAERDALVISTGAFPRVGNGAKHTDPTWYEALGHDAASLGAAALANFSVERVDDARAVTALHARARNALASVRVKLWSSQSEGFAGGQQLARRLSVVEARQLSKVRAP
ncbi:MAG TPA: hypothetical protein VK524_22720 [Polyangiaceae bacterium]|nr:hypothetical protein [Polyangiaceae bacterium]